MATIRRNTDAKGRITLPKGFANSTVIIEEVSETLLRLRKARVVPEESTDFVEEEAIQLSARDFVRFLDMIDKAPPPKEKLKKLMASAEAVGL